MRCPCTKSVHPGRSILTAGLISLTLLVGGCGLFPDGPDTLGEAVLTPVHESWGYDMQDFTVTFSREVRRRENWDRARQSARKAGGWMQRAGDRLTDAVLDALAGPPEDYNDVGPSDELLQQYFQEP